MCYGFNIVFVKYQVQNIYIQLSTVMNKYLSIIAYIIKIAWRRQERAKMLEMDVF